MPLIWLFFTSIRPLTEIATTRLIFFPRQITWDNYVAAFRTYNILTYVINTLIVCIGTVLVNLILGLPAAYAIARYSFRGERSVFSLLILLRMIPLVAVMVPLFLIFSGLGLLNSYAALIMAHSAFKLPVTIWLLRAFIIDIPRELDDSARVDGCSTWGLITRITLPLVKPGLAATAVLAFLATWNDLLVTLILSSSIDTEMIALGLLLGKSWSRPLLILSAADRRRCSHVCPNLGLCLCRRTLPSSRPHDGCGQGVICHRIRITERGNSC